MFTLVDLALKIERILDKEIIQVLQLATDWLEYFNIADLLKVIIAICLRGDFSFPDRLENAIKVKV